MEKDKRKKYDSDKDPVIRAIVKSRASRTDPDGSYTGRPENRYRQPVQDADDLR